MSKVTNSSQTAAAILNFDSHIRLCSRNQKHSFQKLILIYLSTSVQILSLLFKNARLLWYFKLRRWAKIQSVGLLGVATKLHWVISECHSHPLGFFVAFGNIQHQGSLSSLTSPSANQRPAIHKSHERWCRSQYLLLVSCVEMHILPQRGSLYTQCAPYKPEGIQEWPVSILYLFILILKYELSTIFSIYGIWAVLIRGVEQVGNLVLFFSSKILTYLLNRSIKLLIISHRIKFGSRKRRIKVKNTRFF